MCGVMHVEFLILEWPLASKRYSELRQEYHRTYSPRQEVFKNTNLSKLSVTTNVKIFHRTHTAYFFLTYHILALPTHHFLR